MKTISLLLCLGVLALSFPTADFVETQLPGCNNQAHLFSGYLSISSTKEIHYVLALSADRWSSDPLLVWLQGGPGCSSMQTLFLENGPCVFDDGQQSIYDNPFGFNNRTNVLYLEAPAGVGYSYAKSDSDRTYNDIIAADDNLLALHKFFEKFPEFIG